MGIKYNCILGWQDGKNVTLGDKDVEEPISNAHY